MTIVDQSTSLLLRVGAAPILYFMLALSVVSVAIMLERGWFFRRTKVNLQRLAQAVEQLLAVGDFGGAKELAGSSRSVEAAILGAGLDHAARGIGAAREAMASATALGRLRLEKRLGFLGTLGSNAPFVGLLGTVIGIVQAFEQLQHSGMSGSASADIMGAIAEALVATAIGLAVAIPAVAAYNHFQRLIQVTLGNAEALEHILLSHLEGTPASGADTTPSDFGPRVRLSLAPVPGSAARAVKG